MYYHFPTLCFCGTYNRRPVCTTVSLRCLFVVHITVAHSVCTTISLRCVFVVHITVTQYVLHFPTLCFCGTYNHTTSMYYHFPTLCFCGTYNRHPVCTTVSQRFVFVVHITVAHQYVLPFPNVVFLWYI